MPVFKYCFLIHVSKSGFYNQILYKGHQFILRHYIAFVQKLRMKLHHNFFFSRLIYTGYSLHIADDFQRKTFELELKQRGFKQCPNHQQHPFNTKKCTVSCEVQLFGCERCEVFMQHKQCCNITEQPFCVKCRPTPSSIVSHSLSINLKP